MSYNITMTTRSIGSDGESWVADWLKTTKKWKILGQNIHVRFGEIDILALDGREIVIVEVKAKATKLQGAAVEMVTPQKQQTLARLAKFLESQYNKPVRVDVVTLDTFPSNPVVHHYQSAVGE